MSMFEAQSVRAKFLWWCHTAVTSSLRINAIDKACGSGCTNSPSPRAQCPGRPPARGRCCSVWRPPRTWRSRWATPSAASGLRLRRVLRSAAGVPQLRRPCLRSCLPGGTSSRYGSLRGAAPGLAALARSHPGAAVQMKAPFRFVLRGERERTSCTRCLESRSRALKFEEVESRVRCHMTETEGEETENNCWPTSHLTEFSHISPS